MAKKKPTPAVDLSEQPTEIVPRPAGMGEPAPKKPAAPAGDAAEKAKK